MKARSYKTLSAISIVIISLATFIFAAKFPARKKMNVVLITIDALRSDHLGCYGYFRNTSPNIDRVAKEGEIFLQAVGQSPRSPTSFGTILTSNMPNEHNLVEWGVASLNKKLVTLTKALKSQGYRTIFLGNCKLNLGELRTIMDGVLDDFDIVYPDVSAMKVTDRIISFINDNLKNRFFVWVHYSNTHTPYSSSDKYLALFTNDSHYDKENKLPIVKAKMDIYGGLNGISEVLAGQNNGIDNPDYYIAQYDGGIRTVDDEVARIIGTLRKNGLYSNTLIIISSDHGEMLGEHGYYFHHGCFLYEPLLEVPFIIKADGMIPRGTKFNLPVSIHLSLAPTVLDILGINKPATMKGKSLLRKMGRADNYIFSEDGFGLKSVRYEEWKLIYYENYNQTGKPKYELFNLVKDPKESTDLVSMEENIFLQLKNKLDSYKRKAFFKPVLDDDSKAQLKYLGYIQ